MEIDISVDGGIIQVDDLYCVLLMLLMLLVVLSCGRYRLLIVDRLNVDVVAIDRWLML